MRHLNKLLSLACIALFSCSGNNEISSSRLDQGLVENDAINEASGIDASLANPTVLWTHNDSGDPSRIFAMDLNGKHLGAFTLKGIIARDWEDIAVGPGPEEGKSYIYIADIGDNRAKFEDKYIYRFEEPDAGLMDKAHEISLNNIETIRFRFPDGKRDAETLMIDPWTKDLIIISKREEQVRIYRLAYPQKTGEILVPEHVGTIPYTQICGGDISNSGSGILIKNYDDVLYWPRTGGQSIAEAMSGSAEILDYIPEPLGEAVCWSADEKGYFTLSEEANRVQAHLYYYPF